MAGFENRSGAYFLYVSSGSTENRHLQAAMATFGSGSQEAGTRLAATTSTTGWPERRGGDGSR